MFHIVCYYVQRYNFYNICYNFPIVFRNVYHQRCTTTDVCSHGPKENKSKTDIVQHKPSIQLWLNPYQCFHYRFIISRLYISNIKIFSGFKYSIQGLRRMYLPLRTGWGAKIKTHLYPAKFKKTANINLDQKQMFKFKTQSQKYLVYCLPAVLRKTLEKSLENRHYVITIANSM